MRRLRLSVPVSDPLADLARENATLRAENDGLKAANKVLTAELRGVQAAARESAAREERLRVRLDPASSFPAFAQPSVTPPGNLYEETAISALNRQYYTPRIEMIVRFDEGMRGRPPREFMIRGSYDPVISHDGLESLLHRMVSDLVREHGGARGRREWSMGRSL